MRNLIYSLQAVLVICALVITGATITGAQQITPYLIPLMLVCGAVIVTTRGGSFLMHHQVSDQIMARMYMRGILCGMLATLLYIAII